MKTMLSDHPALAQLFHDAGLSHLGSQLHCLLQLAAIDAAGDVDHGVHPGRRLTGAQWDDLAADSGPEPLFAALVDLV